METLVLQYSFIIMVSMQSHTAATHAQTCYGKLSSTLQPFWLEAGREHLSLSSLSAGQVNVKLRYCVSLKGKDENIYCFLVPAAVCSVSLLIRRV